MKILVINYEYPPLGGGAGNATQQVSQELAALGHEICVLTTWFEGTQEDVFVNGVRLIRIKSKRARTDRSNPLEMFDFVQKAKKKGIEIVASWKPDIAISFFALPSGLVALHLKKKCKLPYIISLRGGDVPGFLPNELKLLHLLSTPFTHVVWRHATLIVANSYGLQSLAQKTADRFKKEVLYIPNGVDQNLFKPDESKKNSIFKILFVGRLIEQKGVRFIIDACKKLKDIHPDILFECEIIGDGPLKDTLVTQAGELGVQDIVYFSGWVERNKLPQHYQSAHVFVLSSYEEGMPNVVLEAMSAGLPIIATDVTGNNELVDDTNGILVKDCSELGSAFSLLMANPTFLERLSKGSLLKVSSMTWKAVAEQYAKLIQ